MTAPVFFAEVAMAAVGAEIVLAGDEGRHAADVRRLRQGEAVDLTDGRGALVHAVVSSVRRGELTVTVRERVEVGASPLRLTVVQALAKGGRDEQAVESMTEVGVDHVIGWNAARNVAHWTDRTQAKWTTTARAAAKQSRRAWWPVVSGPASTADVAELCRSAELAVVLHETASEPLAGIDVPPTGDVIVVVGPEGGITGAELATLAEAGAHVVRLGETVLRSSTAGVAALAVVSTAGRWR